MRSSFIWIIPVAIAGCGGATETNNSDSGQAIAGPASSDWIPPEIATAIADWSMCRTAKIADLVATDRSEEAVVDEALGECVADERTTVSLWERRYGPGSGRQVQGLRARWREALIANVRQMRAGTPLSADDPGRAWGLCVGRNLRDPAPGTITPEALVDAALYECVPEMRSVQAYFAQRYGDASAATHVEQMRTQLRRLAFQTLEERAVAR
jgi:hypothetical protein